MTAGKTSKHVLWDLPVRLIHWALVLLIATQWWTAENNMMGLHRQSGMVLVGFLVFRLYWGLAGTPTARFTHFLKGPGRIIGYLKTLRRPYRPTFGHNPIGGLSVVAMLGALSVQVGTGLFAVDVDGIESGPLSHHVSFDQGRQLAEIHETSFDVLVALIALHVAAIAFYVIALRVNLISAMITGRRDTDAGDATIDVKEFPWVRILIGLLLSGAAIFFIQQ